MRFLIAAVVLLSFGVEDSAANHFAGPGQIDAQVERDLGQKLDAGQFTILWSGQEFPEIELRQQAEKKQTAEPAPRSETKPQEKHPPTEGSDTAPGSELPNDSELRSSEKPPASTKLKPAIQAPPIAAYLRGFRSAFRVSRPVTQDLLYRPHSNLGLPANSLGLPLAPAKDKNYLLGRQAASKHRTALRQEQRGVVGAITIDQKSENVFLEAYVRGFQSGYSEVVRRPSGAQPFVAGGQQDQHKPFFSKGLHAGVQDGREFGKSELQKRLDQPVGPSTSEESGQTK